MKFELGDFTVKTSSEGGYPVEEHAEELLDRLIFISGEAHPAIRDQAIAFKDQIRPLIVENMRQAIISDRLTLAGKLRKNGQFDMAKIITEL